MTRGLFSVKMTLFFMVHYVNLSQMYQGQPYVVFLKIYNISIQLHEFEIFLSSYPTYVVSFSPTESF